MALQPPSRSNSSFSSASHAQVATVVAFYMISALVMVFVNKAVLLSTPSLPLTLLCIQLFISVVLLHLSSLFFPRTIEIPSFWALIRCSDSEKVSKLWTLIFVSAIGLVFNTLCLRDVDASFFQIARGLILPLTIAASSISTRTSPSRDVLVASFIVTAGFLLGVTPSLSPSHPAIRHTPLLSTPIHSITKPLSLLYGLISSITIAIHAVLVKSSLPHAQNSTIHLAYYTNFGALLILLPLLVVSGEPWKLLDLIEVVKASPSSPALSMSLESGRTALDGIGKSWNWSVFVSGSIITGIFGFLFCISSLLSVKVTSPVTHMFSSAGRSVLQTVLGVLLFNEILTLNRAVSILTILFGTIHYIYVKTLEATPPSPLHPFHEKDLEDGLPLHLTLAFDRSRDLSPRSDRSQFSDRTLYSERDGARSHYFDSPWDRSRSWKGDKGDASDDAASADEVVLNSPTSDDGMHGSFARRSPRE